MTTHLPMDPARDVRPIALAETGFWTSLSADLGTLVSDTERTITEETDRGIEARIVQTWTAPVRVPNGLREEANSAVAALRQRLEAKSGPQVVGGWLKQFGLFPNSTLSPEGAAAKLAAYAVQLAQSFPLAVFTEASRERAARSFSWFPSYAELFKFLTGELEGLQTLRKRLTIIADPANNDPKARREAWLARVAQEAQERSDRLAAVNAATFRDAVERGIYPPTPKREDYRDEREWGLAMLKYAADAAGRIGKPPQDGGADHA